MNLPSEVWLITSSPDDSLDFSKLFSHYGLLASLFYFLSKDTIMSPSRTLDEGSALSTFCSTKER